MRHSPSLLSRVTAFAVVVFLAGPGQAGEAVPDPAITVHGVLNPAAPAELGAFAFLVGKWRGTATTRAADGTSTEYEFEWIGRYILGGMAIADELRMPAAQGGAVQGISFRYFDPATKSWAVEYLNFNRSFLRKQVGGGAGAVTQDGAQVKITQSGPADTLSRELYTLLDAEHFTYSLDISQDGGQTWDEGNVVMEMAREE